MRHLIPRLARTSLRSDSNHRSPFPLLTPRFYSSLTSPTASLPRSQQAINSEFDQDIENELARLPAARAQEARRRLRNERRAELNGQSVGRKDSVIIPYIPPYEGPDPKCSRGLWTHILVGLQKNRLKDAWGQWLGQRQSKQNVDSVLSPGNPSWMQDFIDEAYASIILAHHAITSGSFDHPQVKKSFHPAMIESLQSKRKKLLNSYSPSHQITWMKHTPTPENEKSKSKSISEKEMEIVAMRAAPFDQGGTIVQIAVRFRSLQSLEIRDERGLLVFGSHSAPQMVMEYYVFQRRMGHANQSFLLFQEVGEDVKPDCLPV